MSSRSTDRREPPGPRLPAGRAFPPRVLFLAAGAVALRLLLLLGRGDYLAFDEGWYLLLARSLYIGEGYTLVGFPHTALSPLFPILAGAAGSVMDSWVWGGRLVGALASGLLVLPAWSVFRRLASDRTAFIAAALVAVLPSLAPFTVPFWIGADLWVGAEPLLHLLLYAAVALWLRADESEAGPAWLAAGATFGLAFLARPEAIITWGLLGLAAIGLAAWARSRRRLVGAVLMGVGFLAVASPYWLYLHDVSGQWSITGRGVSLPTVTAGAGPARSGASRTIERMLWADDEAYREHLYGLDASGLRLRSSYWGVPRTPADGSEAGPLTTTDTSPVAGPAPGSVPAPPDPGPRRARPAGDGATDGSPSAGPGALYLRALGMILPLLLWLFVLLGAVGPRPPGIARRELPVTGALIGTSLSIVAVVAVDPRTQLFLVPLLAFYAARGFGSVEAWVRDRWPESQLRPGFVELVLVGTALVWLLGIDARRLYLSLAVGSPHHIVGEQNREVAEELGDLLESADGPVASWHPAIAVYADRDWRVLPHTDLPGIVRYLDAAGAEALVLSAYYPPDLRVEDLGTRYLILPVPESAGRRQRWQLRILAGDSIRAVGRLEPAP